jgi:micrococcal nuclease
LAADGFIPFSSWRVVRGKVHSVSLRREASFVNFAADWKSDFTVILKPALAKKLQAESWIGQNVEVRGWVESYYGPAIKVTAPAQIRLLTAAKSRTNKP